MGRSAVVPSSRWRGCHLPGPLQPSYFHIPYNNVFLIHTRSPPVIPRVEINKLGALILDRRGLFVTAWYGTDLKAIRCLLGNKLEFRAQYDQRAEALSGDRREKCVYRIERKENYWQVLSVSENDGSFDSSLEATGSSLINISPFFIIRWSLYKIAEPFVDVGHMVESELPPVCRWWDYDAIFGKKYWSKGRPY